MDSSVCLSAILLALYFSGTECNPILAVVGFACANCAPKPRICCTGTFILPTFVLTSRTCAETCHAIDFGGREIPLTDTYVHVHHGPHLKGIPGVDGAAIARISNVMHNNYVKLSPLEALSAIGFKVLIPRFSDNKITLKPAVITLCEKGSVYTDGYYICTAVNVKDRCSVKQGSPMFFNGKIIGILGLRSIKTCKYLQTAFIAIAPFMSWIQMVVNDESSISSTNAQETMKKDMIDPDTITETTITEIMPTLLSQTEVDVKTTFNQLLLITAVNSTITTNNDLTTHETIFPHARNILRAKDKNTTKKKYSVDLRSKKTLVTKRKPIKRKNTLIASKNSFKSPITIKKTTATTSSVQKINTKHPKSNTTKIATLKISSPKSTTLQQNTESKSTAICNTTTVQQTKIRETTEKVPSTPQTDGVISSTLVSTTTSLDTELSLVAQVTSAMDWFNNKIRSKLKENPPVFELTTEPVSEALTTEFVDLT